MLDSQKESKVNEADEDSDADDVMLDLQKSENKENISEKHQENDVAEITNIITQIDLHTDIVMMAIFKKNQTCTLIRK